MAVVEIESGFSLLFPEHETGIMLTESDAIEVAASICEALISRHMSGDISELVAVATPEVSIRGHHGGEILMKINRQTEREII